jgi:dihydropteroate synthase
MCIRDRNYKIKNWMMRKLFWRSKGRLLEIELPAIMGIINITPDSFYKHSRVESAEHISELATRYIEEGASILDVGGASSRPGSEPPSPSIEKERIALAINTIKSAYPDSILSVDTYRSEVAEHALQLGADIVNDISSGMLDSQTPEVAAHYKVPYIAMHIRGTPKTMQSLTEYEDVTQDVLDFFLERINFLKGLGIIDLMLDPGFGFSKTMEQNYQLLKELEILKTVGYPILAGISRKSMVSKFLNISPDEALPATSALHMAALNKGADMLRVHDVKEAKQVIDMYKLLYTHH